MTTAMLRKLKAMEWLSMSPDLTHTPVGHPQVEGGENIHSICSFLQRNEPKLH